MAEDELGTTSAPESGAEEEHPKGTMLLSLLFLMLLVGMWFSIYFMLIG